MTCGHGKGADVVNQAGLAWCDKIGKGILGFSTLALLLLAQCVKTGKLFRP